MALWWPLLVLAAAYALCRILLFLIPPTVPSIDVDASDAHGSWGLCGIYSNGIGSDRVLLYAVLEDANQNKEDSYIYSAI
uniref:Uncharacterized protein n=1 Tax=Oryza glumipatula TaxID=40148 RepID=A0A0E0APJ1_9ORYZ